MHRLCALALLFAVGAVQAQDDAPAGDGEVLLQTERLDLLPWYVSVQGFAHVRRMKCTVTLAGNQGISIKGGTPEDRALLVKVATLFEAVGAAGLLDLDTTVRVARRNFKLVRSPGAP